MSQVKTVEQLRNVLPAPRETTKAKIAPFLDEQAIDFLQTCPFGLMATAGRDGPIEVSPKGDEPGFVRVENERTVLLPERAGNNLAFGLQNIIETGRIGMIFLRPRTGETLRLSGRAEIFDDADLLADTRQARPPGTAGDPDPHRTLLFPLRAFGAPIAALGTGALAGSQAHLVRKDVCDPDRWRTRIRRRRSTPLSSRDTPPICGRTVDERLAAEGTALTRSSADRRRPRA